MQVFKIMHFSLIMVLHVSLISYNVLLFSSANKAEEMTYCTCVTFSHNKEQNKSRMSHRSRKKDQAFVMSKVGLPKVGIVTRWLWKFWLHWKKFEAVGM